MIDFQKYTRHHLRLILSPHGRQQSLSLGINPVDITVPCYPHGNSDNSHSCDEYGKSALLVVCHMPESILWLILQARSRTTRCQVVQFVPSTSISRQFVSKLLTTLQLIPVLPVCIDDHPNKEAKLWIVAPLCLPLHSIVQHIFEHVPPCRRSTLPFVSEVSATPVLFLLLQQKYVTQTFSRTVQWLFHSVCIHVECIPSTHGQETMCVRQYPRLSSISSTWEPYSASCQPFWCHLRFLTEITLVSDERTYIPSSEFVPNQASSNCLSSIAIGLMGVQKIFVQEVPQDLQLFPRISAICVVEDVSIRLEILT